MAINMKTKGVNEERQLSILLHQNSPDNVDEQTMHEVFMKNMITSCFAYGGAEKDSYNFTQYIKKYRDKLTEDVFDEVYNEQMEYLKGFVVQSGVYTDSEGGSYNALVKMS